MDFDAGRAAVVAGGPSDAVVGRWPGLVCVAQGADPTVLARLIELCEEVAKDQAQAPARVLARRLAGWLGATGPDTSADDLRFGTLAVEGEQWATFLSGAVELVVPEQDLTLSGMQSAAWTDRLIPAPEGPVALSLSGVAVPADTAGGVHDLRLGVVPGGGLVLAPGEPGESSVFPGVDVAVPAVSRVAAIPPVPAEPAAAEPAQRDRPPAPEVPEPVRHAEPVADIPPTAKSPAVQGAPVVEPVPPRRAEVEPVVAATGAAHAVTPSLARRTERILGVDTGEPPRPPLAYGAPVGAPPPTEDSTTVVDQTPKAQGHLCSRGHLNDPRSHFCVLCGIRMNERTGVLVIGSRPPLGLLVFDDGSTYTVDAEYLVGRMPESDQRVRSGVLRAIIIEDRSGSVSRVHAEVRVSGWDVLLVDSGSRNGTYVAGPGEPGWTPLPPQQSRRLVPGTKVRLGARTFVFESPSGVR